MAASNFFCSSHDAAYLFDGYIMINCNTWIKWYRSMSNWEWRNSPNHYSVFGYCLENASHKEIKYRGAVLQPGSFVTSYELISANTGLTTRQIRTVLKDLISTNELTKTSNRKGTIISITNWDQ